MLLLAGGGAFGFWYWQKQQAPTRAAEEFMAAFKSKDWKKFYNLIEFPEAAKAQLDEQKFVTAMGLVGNMVTLKSYKIGAMENKGDTATVKVTATVSTPAMMGMPAGDKTNTNDLPLKLVNGKWKLDATGAGGGMPGLGPLGSMRAP